MNDSNQTRAQQLIGELKEAIIHLAFYAGWPKAMRHQGRQGNIHPLTARRQRKVSEH
ncbi:hypothetical protein [Arthrobacter humicola]